VAESATSIEDVLKGIIGKPTEKAKVVIERAPVQHFADAVLSASPIYHSPEAATQAGIQPSDAPVANPLGEAMGPLMAKGGLILHGEQEFIYHRPVQVGDVLVGEGTIADAYQKESKGRTMTFIVQETNWSDEKTGEPVVTTRFNVIHRV
jgi:acyl dehydratase